MSVTSVECSNNWPDERMKLYRPGVGIMLLNKKGLVWIGKRSNPDKADMSPFFGWQMPQGGICAGEKPEDAAKRELFEETGVRSCSLLAESARWTAYDLPEEIAMKLWFGRWKGQVQKWFAFAFIGDDSEISLDVGIGGKQEFSEWRWKCMKELPGLVVPFKRQVYEFVVQEFAHITASIRVR